MTDKDRRTEILTTLNASRQPINSEQLAEILGVDRVEVISDVAVLRSSGYEIIPTPRGYLLDRVEAGDAFTAQFAVRHTKDETTDELYTIVDNGGKVIDVLVEHPVYGDVKGLLNIATREDADNFVEQVRTNHTAILSTITEGVHIHTIEYKSLDDISRIQNALAEKGYLLK